MLYHYNKPGVEVAVWEANEDSSFFESELKKLNFPMEAGAAVKHPEKRHQWFASRYLLCLLHPEAIALYKSRKPYLFNGPAVSISHSGNTAGVMLGEKAAGLDLQWPDEKLRRIATKFTTPGEVARIGITDELTALTFIWSIKEAVFKYYGTELPFLQIEITGFDPARELADVRIFRKGKTAFHKVTATAKAGPVIAFVFE
ncbi:MAG: 4'-phosphopantetheinyl transferase superfamily protein [Flavobacteriales bacterium]|nr:4'-phosphopantetheinyl transferase superfamily protein [Flavobacteriales bacterium]